VRFENIAGFIGGWFVGAFEPALIRLPECEVAIKRYSAGKTEPKHHHKIATEITVIISGEAKINGNKLVAGDICIIEPNETAEFQAITDVTTVVVKSPSVHGDKYLEERK